MRRFGKELDSEIDVMLVPGCSATRPRLRQISEAQNLEYRPEMVKELRNSGVSWMFHGVSIIEMISLYDCLIASN